MALFNILDLTHWSAWGDFLLTWKHRYYLPTRGNSVVFVNSTGAIGKVVVNGLNWGGVDVAWTQIFCFRGVAYEWISSVFELSVVFLIAVLSLLSSLDDMIVCVKLLVYDVWSSKEDRIGFLSIGVHIFDRLYLKNYQFPCPWWQWVL